MIRFDLMEEIRIEKGIEVNFICDKLDINKSTYSRWKNGKIDPPSTKLKMLCDILGIGIEEVFK
ncbi:helix-turn-helix transcriptional regulator [Paraclostridium bifermentans]|nr:helix-turn-helix transcriptional regulator [Paraclostridium bifermentans]